MRKLIKALSTVLLSILLIASPISSTLEVKANSDTGYLLNYYGLNTSDCDS